MNLVDYLLLQCFSRQPRRDRGEVSVEQEALVSAILQTQCRSVSASFQGGGDSGDLEEIEFEGPRGLPFDARSARVKIARIVHESDPSLGQRVIVEEVSFHDAAVDAAWGIAYTVPIDWVNNEGGSVRIYADRESVEVDYTENQPDEEYEE